MQARSPIVTLIAVTPIMSNHAVVTRMSADVSVVIDDDASAEARIIVAVAVSATADATGADQTYKRHEGGA
jgi:hypothetical protein